MNELTYTRVGDYSLPNLKLPQQPEVTLGRYAQMRREFLKEHHRVLYYNLLTRGELTQHLAEVDVYKRQILYELKIGGTRNVYAIDTERKRDGRYV